jgi:hypothetical protein
VFSRISGKERSEVFIVGNYNYVPASIQTGHMPMQENGADCGVFVCIVSLHLVFAIGCSEQYLQLHDLNITIAFRLLGLLYWMRSPPSAR